MREYMPVGSNRRLECHHDQWHIKAVEESSGKSVVVPTARMSTVAVLKDACCAAFDVEPDEVEIESYQGVMTMMGGSSNGGEQQSPSIVSVRKRIIIIFLNSFFSFRFVKRIIIAISFKT